MQVPAARAPTRYIAPGSWLEGALLLIMLMALAMALRAAQWTEGLAVLGPVVLGGFLLGMALSYSRWDGFFPVLHSLVVGIVWVLWWVSQTPQVPQDLNLTDRIVYIGESLAKWLLLLFSNEPVRSNLVFVLELSFLLWWLSFLAAWAVFREGRVWRAIIPTALVLLVNLYYAPPGLTFYLVVFVVSALLLAVRNHLSEQEIKWRIERIRYPGEIQVDFLRDGAILAVLVLGIAMIMPDIEGNDALSARLQPLREPWQNVEQQWGRLFGSLNYRGPGVGNPVFGDSLTLGGPRNLGNQVIMDVRSNEGRYWRAVAFDTFTGRRWINRTSLVQDVDAASHVRTPEFQSRREITQSITVMGSTGGVLMAASQPVRVSLKAEADLNVIEPAPAGQAPLAEISILHRRGKDFQPGDTYLAVSSLSTATVEDLQEADTDYPAWVSAQYLALPPDLSARVGELAQRVTAGAATPYDQAAALEKYLRTFTYNDQIAAPPDGVNAVDYFLFDVQQGYCDYYASAFAMMARSLGIPARVAAGYSQGEYLPDVGAYRVRERNGHSWPEVFFPGYGWVEFEPTAAELEIARSRREPQEVTPTPPPSSERSPEDDSDLLPDRNERFPDQQPPEDVAGQAVRQGWWVALLGLVLALAAMVFLLWRPARQRATRLIVDPQASARLYGQLLLWARRLRLPLLASQTPHEQATLITAAVPQGQAAIESIAELYVEDLYSPRPPDPRRTRQTAEAWTSLEPQLRRHWLESSLRRMTGIRRRRPAPEEPAE